MEESIVTTAMLVLLLLFLLQGPRAFAQTDGVSKEEMVCAREWKESSELWHEPVSASGRATNVVTQPEKLLQAIHFAEDVIGRFAGGT